MAFVFIACNISRFIVIFLIFPIFFPPSLSLFYSVRLFLLSAVPLPFLNLCIPLPVASFLFLLFSSFYSLISINLFSVDSFFLSFFSFFLSYFYFSFILYTHWFFKYFIPIFLFSFSFLFFHMFLWLSLFLFNYSFFFSSIWFKFLFLNSFFLSFISFYF